MLDRLASWPLESPPNCGNRYCMAPAECAVEGEPLCIGCADLLVERLSAVSMVPELRDTLPELWT